LIGLLISVTRDSHDVHGMFGMCLLSSSSANRCTGACHGFGHAHSAGWSFGDLFIENFPASLSYTGMYGHEPCIPASHTVLSSSSPVQHLFLAQRLLNGSEKTMGNIEPFVLAWISGSEAILALAVSSRLSHWWFWSQVEEYVRPLFHPPFSTSPFILILSSPTHLTHKEK